MPVPGSDGERYMLIPFDSLFKKYQIQAGGVLHLGANLGQEAHAYAQQGIRRVIWVEALPVIYFQLVRATVAYPGSTCLCACVSDRDGDEVTFHVANNGGQSSSILEFGTHLVEHPSVQYIRDEKMVTTRVDTLLKAKELSVGPDWFLNIDLQGAELLALKGMGDLIHRFRYAYIEVNVKALYQGCPMVREIDDYLRKFGLIGRETKMTGSGWGDRFYMR